MSEGSSGGGLASLLGLLFGALIWQGLAERTHAKDKPPPVQKPEPAPAPAPRPVIPFREHK